jgi:hypothetical protein
MSKIKILIAVCTLLVLVTAWSSFSSTAYSQAQSANSNNVKLGTPQFSEATNDKVTSMKPAVINGTHGTLLSFTGHGILGGVNATDTGTAFVTNGTGGDQYQTGHGKYTTASGGVAPFTFIGVIHPGLSIGTQFNSKATGNLSFLGNAAGIFKVDVKAGKISGMVWFWK